MSRAFILLNECLFLKETILPEPHQFGFYQSLPDLEEENIQLGLPVYLWWERQEGEKHLGSEQLKGTGSL